MVIEQDQTGNLSQLANWTIHYLFIGKSSMSCTFFYVNHPCHAHFSMWQCRYVKLPEGWSDIPSVDTVEVNMP